MQIETKANVIILCPENTKSDVLDKIQLVFLTIINYKLAHKSSLSILYGPLLRLKDFYHWISFLPSLKYLLTGMEIYQIFEHFQLN